jgi:hypothetical protein
VRRFIWIPFAVSLLAFALPFATVSCGDRTERLTVEPSGADLVLRTPPETKTVDGRVEVGQMVVEYAGGLATAAFLAFAVALIAARARWRGGWAALSALVGIAALLFLRSRDTGLSPRGEADVGVSVDVRLGAFLAVGAAAVGVLAAGQAWLREEGRPSLRPLAPIGGAALLIFAYLLPSKFTEIVTTAYADELNVRRPWEAVFWLLGPTAAVILLARRRVITPRLAAFCLGVLVPMGVVTVRQLWILWLADVLQPGVAQFLYLAGLAFATAFAIDHLHERHLSVVLAGAALVVASALAFEQSLDLFITTLVGAGVALLVSLVLRRGRAGRPAAKPPEAAPAPAPAPRPDAPSAPGSAGSPPGGR